MKKIVTPGRLYAMLAREYRRLRGQQCTQCTLPLPVAVSAPPSGPTWKLDAMSRECGACASIISRLVARYQALYDLMDPFVPHRPLPPQGQQARGHPLH